MDQPAETYTHGHHESVVSQHARRTAADAAAFLLPHLRAGMRLLDFGCGPGSITAGLAEAVAPGEVVAIDVVEEVLEQARAHATARSMTNVRFESGSIYKPAYGEGSFDVVYGHQVLQHLSRPVDALRQARWLLRPGGVLGVREADYGAMTWAPADQRLTRFFQVYAEVARRNGGNANAGRELRGWLVEAGFDDVTITTSTWTFADPDATQRWGDSWAQRVTESALAGHAIEYGIATREELQEIAVGWREWARWPTAFFAVVHVEGLGRRRH